MRFIGLDVHKRVVEAAILGGSGEVLSRHRFECTREAITRFATEVAHPSDRLALEATTNTWGIVDLLEPHLPDITVSNPMKTRAIAEAKIKTDKVDAEVLAQLLRCDFLPRVWRPDPETRRMRSLTSRRASLVQDRTAIKNRLHSVLHQRLIHPPVVDLFGKAGLAFLRELELDEVGRLALDSDLRLLEGIEREIALLDDAIARAAYRQEQVKLLMTLPGVDLTVASSLVAALGDISRFKSADKAAAYLGLVPRTKQSAEHCYHGPITKQGNRLARWLMIQAAQHLGKNPGPIGVFFRRIKKKKGHNVAVVAGAHKLVLIAWHMLTSGEPYRYAQPRSTEQKLSRLRVRATGKRRKGGNGKGKGRHPNHGTGKRTRTVRALDEVYEVEGLPARAPLPPGEQRHLERSGTREIVYRLDHARILDRTTGEELAAAKELTP